LAAILSCKWLFENYQVQLYDAVLFLVASIIDVQAAARVPLVCGFAATDFHEFLVAVIDASRDGAIVAGTLLFIHASYFSRKSSHSATPTLSADAVAAGVAAGLMSAAFVSLVAAGDAPPGLVAFVLSAGAEHPIIPIANAATAANFKSELFIIILLQNIGWEIAVTK
jgi:hypothetical protein